MFSGNRNSSLGIDWNQFEHYIILWICNITNMGPDQASDGVTTPLELNVVLHVPNGHVFCDPRNDDVVSANSSHILKR